MAAATRTALRHGSTGHLLTAWFAVGLLVLLAGHLRELTPTEEAVAVWHPDGPGGW